MLLQYFGNTFGPGTALILFSRLGNDWTLEECSVVMRAGQVVAIPALILLWFMNDDFCESDDNEDTEISTYQLLSDDSDTEENMRNDEVDEEENDNEALLDTNDEEHENSALCCIPMHRVVPVMVASADIMAGLVAGMSIRYFPIFFLDNLKLSPAQVQVVFMCSMLSMAIMGRLAQWIGKKLGRLQVTICCKWTGAFLLMTMVAAYKNGANALCVCVLFILRTCIMNSPGALTRSVLMDHVPKEERAKWSALESVNMFSWSGSAALGGFLVDSEGILFNFTFTSVLQLFATIPLILVFKRVKSEN
ncbi:MFS general substrate transporter [Chaetoceros tenuissimus]|uniref:MFS general substrate transporter n=1 Tax=Chaetoceros tenuissimus TaxID=426638 RepID=A0AAD3H8Z6_9STRA|nr:MFS general substrate transporter [Chaetoceros tenuissimus]